MVSTDFDLVEKAEADPKAGLAPCPRKDRGGIEKSIGSSSPTVNRIRWLRVSPGLNALYMEIPRTNSVARGTTVEQRDHVS